MSVNLVLFDSEVRDHLLPFTYTRPVAEIRIGILTIREKWEQALNVPASFLTQEYLSIKYPLTVGNDNLLINGSVLPDETLISEINDLTLGESLWKDQVLIAAMVPREKIYTFKNEYTSGKTSASENIISISRPWHIFSHNDASLRRDFIAITKGRKSAAIPAGNQTIQPENIFIEEGANVQGAFLNASSGPIYIGKDSEVMEGTLIRGPFALCEHASTKLATKIYGATTVGPHCKVGGELNNVVMFSYSNKGHDGFLGNAVIGEWCNLGADTNNSNLKNNYAPVKLWSHVAKRFENTGLTFCGLMMADHAKCGINTMFNTGTVVGVAANVFGAGFPRNFIPSFAWGGAQGFETFQLPKVYEMATLMASRRHIDFDETEKNILKYIFENTGEHRNWENESK